MYRCEDLKREHIDGVADLCRIEGYGSYTEDNEKTWRALTSPGSCTLVALSDDAVVGFVHMMSDGEIQAFLPMVLVAREHRRRGIGRTLIKEAFSRCGGKYLNLLAEEDARGFYRSFWFREFAGYRIHPQFEKDGESKQQPV